MNLHRLLKQLKPTKLLRVALLGAGKFGAMFIVAAPHAGHTAEWRVADLAPTAPAALAQVGWPASALNASSIMTLKGGRFLQRRPAACHRQLQTSAP